MPLGEDILAVQWEASRALDFEVSGDVDAALDAYSRSSSQLQYLLDVVVDGRAQPDLVAVCRGLLASYARRLQVLSSSTRQQQRGAGGGDGAAAATAAGGTHAAGRAASSPCFQHVHHSSAYSRGRGEGNGGQQQPPEAAATAADLEQWLHLDAAASAASTSDSDGSDPGGGGAAAGAAAAAGLMGGSGGPPPHPLLMMTSAGPSAAVPLHHPASATAALPPAVLLYGGPAVGGCTFGDGGCFTHLHATGDPCGALVPQWEPVGAPVAAATPQASAGGGARAEAAVAAAAVVRQCQRVVTGSLDDVVGLDSVKEELEEAVFLPLRHPHLFRGIRRPPRNFLLYGPPGTGKTLLVEKVAAEAGLLLLALSPSAVLSKWSGEAEKAVRAAFEAARRAAPAALFIDEIDALGRSRGGGGGGNGGGGGGGDDAAARRLLTELLLQMNALASSEEEGEEDGGDWEEGGVEGGSRLAGSGVYVFAATNRMADCDPALLRRFERRIEVPLPDAPARAAFLSFVLARPEVGSALAPGELEAIAAATAGYSGSDMACLCRHAAMAPVRELLAAARQQARARGRGGIGADAAKRRRVMMLGAAAHSDGNAASGFERAEGGSGAEGGEVAAVAEEGGVGVDPAAGAALLGPGGAVRKLVAADFEAALRVIRPSAVDAAAPASC